MMATVHYLPYGYFTKRNHCLLKNTSTKDNKYVVNQTLEHIDDISFRELFGIISVLFLQNNVPSYHKVFVSTLAIHFYMSGKLQD